MRHTKRWMVVGLIVAGLHLSACGQAPATTTDKPKPAEVVAIEGTDLHRVVLTQEAAKRLDIQATAVRDEQMTRKRIVGGQVVGLAQDEASAGTTIVSAPTTAEAAVPAAGAAPSAERLLQQIAAAEAALQSGEFAAVLDYGNGNQTSSLMSFDLGTDSSTPHFSITTIYTSTSGVNKVERMARGDKVWERQPDGGWLALQEQHEGFGQLQSLLPHADRAANAELTADGSITTIGWQDLQSTSDVTVVVDPATGTPREMRQVTPATGVTLTVQYHRWNTPAESEAANVPAPDNRIWIRVALSAGEIASVDRSQPVTILPLASTTDATGIAAKLDNAPATGDSSTADQALYYVVDGTDHGLTPGQRVRVELALTGSGTRRSVVPYSAVIYDLHGETWIYANPEPLTFVREPVAVDYIEGDLAVLERGPSAGTRIVAVGAPELYGTEFGVGH